MMKASRGGVEMKRFALVPVVLVMMAVFAVPAAGCPGATAAGMGYAGLALPPVLLGPDVAYWNPAALDEIQPGFCITTINTNHVVYYSDTVFRYQAYNTVTFIVIPLVNHNIGIGYLRYIETYPTPLDTFFLAYPIMSTKNISIGGNLWFPHNEPTMWPVWPGLSINLSLGEFRFVYRTNSLCRLGASYSHGGFIASYEVYGPNEQRLGVHVPLSDNISMMFGASNYYLDYFGEVTDYSYGIKFNMDAFSLVVSYDGNIATELSINF
jgi:predicted small secreted protein